MMPRHWTGATAAAALAGVLCIATGAPVSAQPAPRGQPAARVQHTAFGIPFAPPEDPSLKDPDNPSKKFRVDFARVEHEHPLSRADLMKVTPEVLEKLTQEQVDQIYGRLTAGPIPNGPYRGTLFFAQGDSLNARLEEILGGIPGRLAGSVLELAELVGGRLWKGKVFERDNGLLRNMIENRLLLRSLVDNIDDVPSTEIPRDILGGRLSSKVWLLFPAKVYCGQSLLDGRRESIVVDYAYTDELPGYRESPDSTAGRGGIRIRDEIRMVRPGLYLGRAYANKMFLLNFTLSNEDEAKRQEAAFAAGGAVSEDCWPGEQVRRTAGR
jgi:hypothetical protein